LERWWTVVEVDGVVGLNFGDECVTCYYIKRSFGPILGVIQLVSLQWSFYGVLAGTTVLAK
jgi:hypothetical protein